MAIEMERTILAALAHGPVCQLDMYRAYLRAARRRGARTNDDRQVRGAVQTTCNRLADAGRIERTWDANGEVFYRLPAPRVQFVMPSPVQLNIWGEPVQLRLD